MQFELLFVARTRVLRHMASELNLNVRSDGYVKVNDLLKLNLKTFANVPLRSHTVDDVREVSEFRFLRFCRMYKSKLCDMILLNLTCDTFCSTKLFFYISCIYFPYKLCQGRT